MATTIRFISFADEKLKPTLRRIGKEAKQSGFFDEIHLLNEKSFEREYLKRYRQWYADNPRGYGYWIWKPYFIRKELRTLKDGDVLVYLDAGCVINASAKERFCQYIMQLSESQPIICFDHISCLNEQYTKTDLIKYFSFNDEPLFLQSRQFMSGILVLRKCGKTLRFVDEWYDICHNYQNLVDDSPSLLPESEKFIEHRHDQSVFTCLCWKYGIKALSQIEVYPKGGDWLTMMSFPFWAKRNKEYRKSTIWVRLINRLKRLLKN